MAYIMAVLKRGTPKQKGCFVYSMFRDEASGLVHYAVLEAFGRGIGNTPETLSAVASEFGELRYKGLSEEQFMAVFYNLFRRKNELFTWLDDLPRAYAPLEDAEENERITVKRRNAAKKRARPQMTLEVERLVSELKLDDAAAEGLRLTFEDFRARGLLTAPTIGQMIRSYGVDDPVANMLAQAILPQERAEPTLCGFVEIMAKLTQPQLVRERNKLLFSLFARKAAISMYISTLRELRE